ncbi:hypothetical protein LP421_33365 (plasmid) [Rhizobium sp. RCAM05350]|nr:hypothetical protein LP421_33365 [Rhizobium sp. RCAM05350]
MQKRRAGFDIFDVFAAFFDLEDGGVTGPDGKFVARRPGKFRARTDECRQCPPAHFAVAKRWFFRSPAA